MEHGIQGRSQPPVQERSTANRNHFAARPPIPWQVQQGEELEEVSAAAASHTLQVALSSIQLANRAR